jgi:hypothetical protein
LREECRLRAFENRMLRKIFGPKTDELAGERRRLHQEELYDLYPSPNNYYYLSYKIKKNEMGGTSGTYGREERCVQGLAGKPEGKRPLRTQRRRLMR